MTINNDPYGCRSTSIGVFSVSRVRQHTTMCSRRHSQIRHPKNLLRRPRSTCAYSTLVCDRGARASRHPKCKTNNKLHKGGQRQHTVGHQNAYKTLKEQRGYEGNSSPHEMKNKATTTVQSTRNRIGRDPTFHVLHNKSRRGEEAARPTLRTCTRLHDIEYGRVRV